MKHYDFSLSPNLREGNFGILSIAGSSGIAASIGLNLKVRVTPHEDANIDDALELLAVAMKQVGGPIEGRSWQVDGCSISDSSFDGLMEQATLPSESFMAEIHRRRFRSGQVSSPGSGIEGLAKDVENFEGAK